MAEPSSILAELNYETRAYHAAADLPWLALLAPNVRRDDYARQLVLTYGFEAPLEGAFAYTDGLRGLIRLRERSRCGLIAQDLLALGRTPAQLARLPQCEEISPFQHAAEAFGWMYVTERATLLHTSVRRNLLQRLPEARLSTSYLAAAGSVAGARWQQLGIVLDQFATTDELAARIALAANTAFRCWLQWMEAKQRTASTTA